MVQLSIDHGQLQLDVRGWSRLWAFKRRLRVPLTQIKAARWDPTAAKGWWKGWRVPGTHVPGVMVAGTFYRRGGREFWDVRDGRHAVTIELEGGRYRRLVVDVADPQGTVKQIEDAVERPAA